MTRVGDLLPGALTNLLPERMTAHRVNWMEVARKEVADTGRSWLLYALCGLFMGVLLVAATINALDPPRTDGQEATLDFALGLDPVVWVIRWLVPLTALIVGYGAVVGEREAGSLRVLLGLPITRREVLVGKLLGRSVAFIAMLLVGLACAGGVLWHLYVGFDPGAYGIFVALTLLLGLIFVGMGVGFSAWFRSRTRAVGASMGTFALLVFVWQLFTFSASNARGGRPATGEEASAQIVFSANANPTIGYESLVEEWVTPLGLESGPHVGTSTYGNLFVRGDEPFYVQPEFLLVVFVFWGLVPVLFGAWRFGRGDLG